MKRIFDDAGLEHLEVEFLPDFFVKPGEPAREQSDRLRRQLFETAAAFDAHHIKVGNIPGTPCELDRLIEEFAALCEDAAEHTDAKIAYEFMPFDVNVNTLDDGARAGHRGRPRPTAAWRSTPGTCRKLSIAPDELRRIPARLPRVGRAVRRPVRGHGGPDRRDDQPPRAARRGRVRHSRRTSRRCARPATTGPWGVEVLSAELRKPADRAGVRARVRDDRRAVRARALPEEEHVMTDELDDERLIWIFTQMLRIREFEERVKRTFEEHPGVIRGHTHLADGAEASIVGSLATLRDGDQLLATYRCHGYPIVLGTEHEGDDGRDLWPHGRTVRRLRRLDAPGRSRRAGFMGTSGIVGQGIPQATGVAFAAQLRSGSTRPRWSCASSATAPPSRARSTSRSTSPRCGSCRSST